MVICMYLGRGKRRYYDNTIHMLFRHTLYWDPIRVVVLGLGRGVYFWGLLRGGCCLVNRVWHLLIHLLFHIDCAISRWNIEDFKKRNIFCLFTLYADVFEWYWIKYNLSKRTMNLKISQVSYFPHTFILPL